MVVTAFLGLKGLKGLKELRLVVADTTRPPATGPGPTTQPPD